MSFYTDSAAPWLWCGSDICPEAAGVVHLGHGTVRSPANQRLLGGAYAVMAEPLSCSASRSAPVSSVITVGPLELDFMEASPRSVIARGFEAVRAASILHELAHAEAAFDNTTLGAGGADEVVGAVGLGKSHVFLQLMARMGFVRPLCAVDVDRIVQSAFAATYSSYLSPLEYLVRHFRGTLGLNRANSRNLRAALLLLVGLRCLVFAWHRDRLNAVGSKGRGYLRTALAGAGTRNAPPAGLLVRRSETTGARNLPLMQLAA